MIPRLLLTSLALVALGACASSSRSNDALAISGPTPAPRAVAAPLAVAGTPARPASCAKGKHVLDCAALVPERPLHFMAMAVSGRSIGIGWTTSGNPWVQPSESGPVHFEILDERLEAVHRLVIPVEAAYDVAVAPWRSGWVVATSDGGATVVRHVGADGSLQGPSLRLDGGGSQHVAVSARDEVLVMRNAMIERTAVVRVALLNGLDEPPRWDVPVIEQPSEPRFGSVVAMDDGFMVAQRGSAGVEVVRIDGSGRIVARNQQVGSHTEYPELASCGATATMVWADFSAHPRLRWTALDGRGQSTTEPVTLGEVPDYFDPSPALCDGLGSLVLLGGYTGGTGVASHLELVQVDGEGRAGDRKPVLGGTQRAYDWRLDRLGDDVVVAWIELEGSIGVARLRAPTGARGAGLRRAR
jgi:hypothetical protein